MDISQIPIVYLWVDGDDPDYKKRHNIKSSSSRNRNLNELMYSFRSIEQNLDWWKGILYIITDKQIPSWLNTNNHRIKIIDHTEIIPSSYLPTRQSDAIQWHIHNIPDIDDYFILMDDDFMFLKKCTPTMFFNDKPMCYFNDNKLNNTLESEEKLKKSIWKCAVHHTMNLLEHKIEHKFEHKLYNQHSARVFSKKLSKELYELMYDEINKSCLNPGRHNSMIIYNYAITYYMIYKLQIDVKQTIYKELFICIKNDFKADSININDEYFVCFNDEYDGNEFVKKEVIKLMESLFPVPSQYEIQTLV